MPNKALTLRLPEEKVAELAAIAQADEMHVSDAVREAIDNHIAARKAAKAQPSSTSSRRDIDPTRGGSMSRART